jgi:predicted regulator of Ras-like GTPase activity (Roadblock/LC7/MglB family)
VRDRHWSLDAEHGRLFVAATGDVAFVLLADPDASAGLLRVALQRALRTVA